MPNLETDVGPVPKRELTVFYVLDTSGSMAGTPIAKLNRAMSESIDILKSSQVSNADVALKIAVLEFNSGCRWVTEKGPEEIKNFQWEDLDAVDNDASSIGAALSELDSKLSRSAFLQSMTGAYWPIIIFMTDGFDTDGYKKALEEIRKNKWFRRAMKIGFAIGDAPDAKMVAEVVGNSEAVLRTDDMDCLYRLVKSCLCPRS